MKSIFIAYNQAYQDIILKVLHRNLLKGYTLWDTVQGKGSNGGEPHLGDHAWPTLNGAILTVCQDHQVKPVLEELKKLDEATPEQGLRAFVWSIEDGI
ncbi:PG0541 family transporter-associated protein [Falsiporphyromonas endometrii]|uniref:PG0541 family transporter-associated protein n=1 Tax=Falsiporphyromonas endometrii TaxID=1387297 RepID=A0ABV9K691_9PORP|nr:hypothetical protein [Porphyromonadaceae bacterium]